MNKLRPILLLAILALATTAPFSNAQAQQLSERQLSQLLKRFPEADADGDGKLTEKEFKAAREQFLQSRQGNGRSATAAQTKLAFDPGWEKDEFPPHAVSLKSPEESMAIYKRGPVGHPPRDGDSATMRVMEHLAEKSADGCDRI